MKEELNEALLEFYQNTLKPEFDGIYAKLVEHDAKFADLLKLMESHSRKV